MFRQLALIPLLATVPLLAGCGGTPVVPERFVYVSSADCAEGGRISFEDCTAAVDKAVAAHEQNSPRYVTMRDCEMTESMDRCERVADRHYRPRIMGYLFTVTKSVSAAALYSGAKGATVFRDTNGAVFDWERTEGVKFSRQAIRKSEGFALMRHQKLRG